MRGAAAGRGTGVVVNCDVDAAPWPCCSTRLSAAATSTCSAALGTEAAPPSSTAFMIVAVASVASAASASTSLAGGLTLQDRSLSRAGVWALVLRLELRLMLTLWPRCRR